MAYQEKQLGQARENSTNPVSVYSPASGVTGIITCFSIVNTAGVEVSVRVFLDDDGATYDESTVISPGWDVDVPQNGCVQVEGFFPMNNASGNFAYRSSVANALTITVLGAEVS